MNNDVYNQTIANITFILSGMEDVGVPENLAEQVYSTIQDRWGFVPESMSQYIVRAALYSMGYFADAALLVGNQDTQITRLVDVDMCLARAVEAMYRLWWSRYMLKKNIEDLDSEIRVVLMLADRVFREEI